MTGRVGATQLTVGAKGWAWLGCPHEPPQPNPHPLTLSYLK